MNRIKIAYLIKNEVHISGLPPRNIGIIATLAVSRDWVGRINDLDVKNRPFGLKMRGNQLLVGRRACTRDVRY